ncbi:amino acid/amide ABC transporter substrate-binding protein, HAAT family [Tistlia consotensis]|uniref:Amino acid/amide ABC transporter substrate-binding protein, HAAT family n=1 Tax=Tistlia consotensis USBA 355 TaxID=560819 RepID=A0A1Y6BMP7_9PROT|nr:ABC transporter substrate-binding protein [Tistlia consotensis]SMF17573.1 amino acid/amide ABC transporter substrate-binding protein, HAAT family [Tistlia consotensis USBA 355]SNR40341.1 amino acid/amide ABC transporter substrate-binding protein, HAAT family [Tistlia consotensis]
MLRRSFLIAGTAALALAATSGPHGARAAEPVKVGELFAYSKIAAFADPYRNGWQLAIDEINAKGGVMGGRQIEVVSRDDGGTTADAVRVADELVTNEKVAFLFGTFFSNVGLAVGDYAKQKKVLFIAAEPLTDAVTMSKGNRYTFRMRPNTYMQTKMLVEAGKNSGARTWGIVAPNYEYGQSAASNFKKLLAEMDPGAKVVVEQYPALGKIDAGATVQALLAAKPEGIFNATFAGDQAKLVREGTLRGLFDGRPVLSLLTGEPEYLAPMKGEAPTGWIVTGYPWEQIDTPEHKAFVAAYQKKYNDTPRLASLLGYSIGYTVKALLDKAGSTDTEKLVDTLEGLKVETPIGPISFRKIDHQSTMGAFVGKLAVEDGHGKMVDWHYADGADYMHSPAEVKAERPAD